MSSWSREGRSLRVDGGAACATALMVGEHLACDAVSPGAALVVGVG
jgi:hypothetical protein